MVRNTLRRFDHGHISWRPESVAASIAPTAPIRVPNAEAGTSHPDLQGSAVFHQFFHPPGTSSFGCSLPPPPPPSPPEGPPGGSPGGGGGIGGDSSLASGYAASPAACTCFCCCKGTAGELGTAIDSWSVFWTGPTPDASSRSWAATRRCWSVWQRPGWLVGPAFLQGQPLESTQSRCGAASIPFLCALAQTEQKMSGANVQ